MEGGGVCSKRIPLQLVVELNKSMHFRIHRFSDHHFGEFSANHSLLKSHQNKNEIPKIKQNNSHILSLSSLCGQSNSVPENEWIFFVRFRKL
jgi:hypothetical protein